MEFLWESNYLQTVITDRFMVALPVSPRREIVNPARPGREQRQQWIRVPGLRRVWAAALFMFLNCRRVKGSIFLFHCDTLRLPHVSYTHLELLFGH